ncbi:hypothetical protein QTI66_39310 [Variovorax sp. J22R133]|uniref:hypothetical protein n=1 Tax=Variovorax brevis TaxID=3053503 RepID=UPI0025779B7C|nr:hypothetical protein [Variovorax sp. J22R133]MDM0118119.1 hypothetical protein [Variovorax sp. J22R133]
MCDPLTREQTLTIFKLYEDKGWAVKQQMLATFGLLTPIVFGLLAFCAKDYLSHTISTTTIAAGWATFSLSLLLAFLIILSLIHANKDYTRSHQLLDHAKANGIFPQETMKILQGEDTNRHPCFRYIGGQFIAILSLGVLLVVVSLLFALAITLRS